MAPVVFPLPTPMDWTALRRGIPTRTRREVMARPDLATFWGVAEADLAPSFMMDGASDGVPLPAQDGSPSLPVRQRPRAPQPLALTDDTIRTIVEAALTDPHRRISPKMLRKLFPDPMIAEPDWGTVEALAARIPGIIVAPKNGHGSYTVNANLMDAVQVWAVLEGATDDDAGI